MSADIVFELPPVPPVQALVDYILDNYQNLSNKCRPKSKIVGVDQCVDCCSRSYYGGGIQYRCGNSKNIYLIRYFASQVQQIRFALTESVRKDVCQRHRLNVISLGGGPGTEAIALIDLLGSQEVKTNLVFQEIDSEESWRDIFFDVTGQFVQYFKGVNLKTSFVLADVTKGKVNTAEPFDIVFLSWILSEMSIANTQRILDMGTRLAKSNGFLIVADRFESGLVDKISGSLAGIKSVEILEHDRQIGHCGISVPDEVKDKFKVRLISDTAYWVLKKH